MRKTRKAILSGLLSLAMVIAMLPGTSMVALAEGDDEPKEIIEDTTNKDATDDTLLDITEDSEELSEEELTEEPEEEPVENPVEELAEEPVEEPAEETVEDPEVPLAGAIVAPSLRSLRSAPVMLGETHIYTIDRVGCTPSVREAEEGTTITIVADAMEGKVFGHWQIIDNASGNDITDSLLSTNKSNPTTTFAMPSKNIRVIAWFDESVTISAKQSDENDKILFAKTSSGFDVQGKDGGNKIKTTFSNNGYSTKMQVGDNPIRFTDFEFGKQYTSNGVKAYLVAALNGNCVDVTYTLINNNSEAKTVKIGSYADTMIGNDDNAPVSFTDNGIKMVSNDGQFAFLVSPVNGTFTTRWYGRCGSREENVFNNMENSETFTGDSGVAWSWTVDVPANTTVTRTARLVAGDAASIMEPQVDTSDTSDSTASISVTGETAVIDETPVVPNLKAEAADQGEDVSLRLDITADPETTFAANPTLNREPEVKEAVKSQFKDESAVKVDVLNINIQKLVAGAIAGSVTSTNSILEIGVGYDFRDVFDPSLVSKHGDEVRTFATLTQRPSAGNYINSSFFADTENNKFYMYSRDFSEFVITYSTVEGNAQNRTLINPNASSGGTTASNIPVTAAVYRVFNAKLGYHFYTANVAEKDALVAAGWNDEGVAWLVNTKGGNPVYRLFDAKAGTHIFTASQAAKAELVAAGCADEGIAFYGEASTGRTVYKVTNTTTGKALLTTSVAEKDSLAAAGYTVEEADFHVN